MPSLPIDPISLSVAGLAVFVLGLGHLLLGRHCKQPSYWGPVVLCAMFAACAGLCWVYQLSMVAQITLLLCVLEATLAVTRSPARYLGGWLATALDRSVVQAVLFVLVGVTLLGFGVFSIDRELEAEYESTEHYFAHIGDPIQDLSSPALLGYTDAGQAIPLYAPPVDADDVDPADEDRYLRNFRLDWKAIRTGPADIQCNCHGWVFTGGRFWIRSLSVPAILKDNHYEVVRDPHVGDLAIFADTQALITHTAVVFAAPDQGLILIEGKWGRMGRFIHTVAEHPYSASSLSYYRSSRKTHLLTGIKSQETGLEVSAVPSQ